ncbi:hypothetical protein GCM10010285_64890 [Streptomyces pseudogriseolus]|uniref:Uncharacterized protein n=1 Tax=Streptomyces pseudogriseolus TaxID=36817 RepID=A0ABQ2TM43_STREZ|nr:hypothetical protein GCM10010285_64890 [Streptomyces rubiginosus]
MPAARALTLLVRPGEPDGYRTRHRQYVGDCGGCVDGPAHKGRRPARVGPFDQRPVSALSKQQVLHPLSVLPGERSEGMWIAPGEVSDISGARAQCLPTAVETPCEKGVVSGAGVHTATLRPSQPPARRSKSVADRFGCSLGVRGG